MEKIHAAAIVLAAGSGKRMQTEVPKQFLDLNGHPLLYYSLMTFEESCVDRIVLVTGADQIAYCRTEIAEKYGFRKVSAIVAGGKERYDSVYAGLLALEKDNPEYVLIHDGARPFVTQDIIRRTLAGAEAHGACVAGMPVKDTIRLVDEEQFSTATPDRKKVWMMQTPQTFSYSLILSAYQKLPMSKEQDHPKDEEIKTDAVKGCFAADHAEGCFATHYAEDCFAAEKTECHSIFGDAECRSITDDAQVLECMLGRRAKIVEGSYENIKITTPSDLKIAEVLCNIR